MRCVIDGCERIHEAKGVCNTHYSRLHRYGTTDLAEVRFWKQVEKSNTCWLWIGTRSSNGYGRFSPGKGLDTSPRIYAAHRWSYEIHVAPIPEGLTIDHLCRVRNCVNPDHLEVVSMTENRRRGLMGVLGTVCRRGHEWTDDNSYINPTTGYRYCRACRQFRDSRVA